MFLDVFDIINGHYRIPTFKEIAITIVFIIGGVMLMGAISRTSWVMQTDSHQSLVCNKLKNTCYLTVAGSKSGEDIKIDNLSGITIVIGQKYYSSGNGNNTQHHEIKTYMPTLLTKQGRTIPIYKTPTGDSAKAEQDKISFIRFIKGSESELKLSNE